MTCSDSPSNTHFVFPNYPLSIFWWSWTNSQYHWIFNFLDTSKYSMCFVFKCIEAFIDDTKHHQPTPTFWCKFPLQILGRFCIPVLTDLVHVLGIRNLHVTNEIRVWFSFLVSVFSAPVSRSQRNTRIPVLKFLNSLDSTFLATVSRCHWNLHSRQNVRNQFYNWFLVASLESAKTDYLRSFATVPQSWRASYLFCYSPGIQNHSFFENTVSQ